MNKMPIFIYIVELAILAITLIFNESGLLITSTVMIIGNQWNISQGSDND